MSERKGKRYTEQEREELLGLFGKSGQSASRFCKEAGLSYPTLKRWLDGAEARPQRFVELESGAAGESRMSVALANGLWAEFPMDADKGVVAAWIRELKAC